jgi:hypothetical protein
MGILDNLENAWDEDFNYEPLWRCDTKPPTFESEPIANTDDMGRDKFWEDLGRPEEANLSVKLFSEICCKDCGCKNE